MRQHGRGRDSDFMSMFQINRYSTLTVGMFLEILETWIIGTMSHDKRINERIIFI